MAKDYPKWIKADVPGLGEVSLVAQTEAEEKAVKAKKAGFKVTRSAQDDSIEIVLPTK